MKYSLDKYKFFIHKGVNKANKPVHEVVAVSTYAGKTVKGVAKVDPQDTFSEKAGKELAAARCNQKIAYKRMKRSEQKLAEAKAQLEQAQRFFDKMTTYNSDAIDELNEANFEVENLESIY